MGVANRTYMQGRKLPSGWGDFGWAVRIALLAVAGLLAVRIAESSSGRPVEPWLLLTPSAVEDGRWWTIVTSAFVPSACGDAAWTLVAFWFFGRVVERDVGAGRLVPLVALAIVVPHLVFLAVCGATDTFDVARGLSGPTAACAVYAAIREPHEYFEVLGTAVRVRVLALVYLGVAVGGFVGWVGRDDARASMEVAGAALGVLAARFAVLPDLADLRGLFSGGGRAPAGLDDATLRARVDALLDKVASGGMDSLSESERAFLDEASKRYR